MEEEKLHFKTNVQLKSIIGKDLINDDNIAILELVKNAYDANSKSALVIFKNVKENDDLTIEENNALELKVNPTEPKLIQYTDKTSRIVIQDYGVGMNKSDIVDKWLNIAYSEKKAQKKQFDRILAGAKGVGRFSCDRLGEYLNIYSRKANENIVHLFVDWKQFEIENNKDLLIQGVDITFREISPEKFKKETGYELFDNGTILEISKLRSHWTYYEGSKWSKEKLLNLKKQLEKLINPNQAYVQNKKNAQNVFLVELQAEEFLKDDENCTENEKINDEIKNKIFEKLNFKTTSIVSEIDNKAQTITTTLFDKGITIYKLVERNEQFQNLNNTIITLYYLSPYSKAYFTKQMGFRSVEFGSIYLFINGFRIPPYGEEGDDWLKIEVRKGQGYSRNLGTREVIGRIEILDENEKFKIISSREGVVKNESYRELADESGYFYKTFRRLENYIVDGIGWDSVPEELKNRFNEIEKRILDNDFAESEEIYAESNSEKFRRIYSLIHSIISTKPKDVISLYVNEDLILQRVKEERDIVEQEFEKILEDFSNNKIGVEVLNRVLEKKAELNKDLQKQLKDFAKYSTEEATAKAILELESLRDLNNKQEKTLKDLVKRIETLEEENKGKEEEIEIKERQILFQQKLLTTDLEQLLEYHHNIGISASAIEGHLINLKDDLNKGKIPNKQDLFELIENVSYETNKITSITNLATAANFNADADEIDADLDEFINQYISRVKQGKLKSSSGDDMQINIVNKSQNNFLYHFKPLEIAIVLDNLLSNSRKAKATEVIVTIMNADKNNLSVSFKDNGNGIKPNNIEKIFDFGFTTTSGSGLGLYHLKKIINNKYNSTIEVNKTLSNGAEFIINFKK